MDLNITKVTNSKNANASLNGIDYALEYTVDSTDSSKPQLTYLKSTISDKVGDAKVNVGNIILNYGNVRIENLIYTNNLAQYFVDFQAILKDILGVAGATESASSGADNTTK